MELTAALLNLFVKDPGYLPKLSALKEQLLARARGPCLTRLPELKPRKVQVLETVKHVLAYADKPLSPKQVQGLCEQFLVHEASMPSVYDCLQRHSKARDSLFVHIGYG